MQSPAASGLVADIQSLPTWLETKVSLTPFRLPEAAEGGEEEADLVTTRHQADFMRMVGHFRTVVMPSQAAGWREGLPKVPMSTEELQVRLRAVQGATEFDVLRRLAALGSASADIVASQMRPAREALREVMYLLGDSRAEQVNLAAHISATRCKVFTGQGVYRAKCPKKLCFEKDFFLHMVRYYGLEPWFAHGGKNGANLDEDGQTDHGRQPPASQSVPGGGNGRVAGERSDGRGSHGKRA